jgi:hypothetical protein
VVKHRDFRTLNRTGVEAGLLTPVGGGGQTHDQRGGGEFMGNEPRREDQRLAAVLLLAAALLGIVGNGLHPIVEPGNTVQLLEHARVGGWMWVHVTIALAIVLVVAGLMALQRLIAGGRGSGYANVGGGLAVVGGTIMAATFAAVDGYALFRLSERWAAAEGAEREELESLAAVVSDVDLGFLSIGTLVLFGLAFAAFGLAMLASRVVAAWLGWVGLALGCGGAIVGMLMAIVGVTDVTLNLLFRPLAVLITVFLIALGVVLWRDAGARGGDATEQETPR